MTSREERYALYMACHEARSGPRASENQTRGLRASDYHSCAPIHAASHSGSVECLKLLLEHCPEGQIHLKDSCAYRAIHIACCYGQAECLKLLLNHLPEEQILLEVTLFFPLQFDFSFLSSTLPVELRKENSCARCVSEQFCGLSRVVTPASTRTASWPSEQNPVSSHLRRLIRECFC